MFLEPRFLHIIVPEGEPESRKAEAEVLREKYDSSLKRAKLGTNYSVVITPEDNILIMVNSHEMNWGEMDMLRQNVEDCMKRVEKRLKKHYDGLWID